MQSIVSSKIKMTLEGAEPNRESRATIANIETGEKIIFEGRNPHVIISDNREKKQYQLADSAFFESFVKSLYKVMHPEFSELNELDVNGTPELRGHYDAMFAGDLKLRSNHQNVSIYCTSTVSFTNRHESPHLYLNGVRDSGGRGFCETAHKEITTELFAQLKGIIIRELRPR